MSAVVSKSKYKAKGKSPLDLKFSSKVTKFLLLKLYTTPGTPLQLSILRFYLSALAKRSVE